MQKWAYCAYDPHFQGVSTGDFQLAPAYPIEKLTLRMGLLYLNSGYESRSRGNGEIITS